jgi:predicted site-specific integrase-resolvase
LSRYIKIGQASELLGVSPQTLRRWEREGQLVADRKSEGGTRYYELNHLLGLREVETDLTVAYARVSSQDQKEDLKRQAENLERYCGRKGWRYELIQDLGSGMNYRKKGLKRLVEMILNDGSRGWF